MKRDEMVELLLDSICKHAVITDGLHEEEVSLILKDLEKAGINFDNKGSVNE
jgi:hypothetical protein